MKEYLSEINIHICRRMGTQISPTQYAKLLKTDYIEYMKQLHISTISNFLDTLDRMRILG